MKIGYALNFFNDGNKGGFRIEDEDYKVGIRIDDKDYKLKTRMLDGKRVRNVEGVRNLE